jgi:nucleoside-diphosphate-sugar epimerase
MKKPKVVVLGSTGMVGHVISLYLLENDVEVVGISRSKLNVDNLSQFSENFKDLDELINNIEKLKPGETMTIDTGSLNLFEGGIQSIIVEAQNE